MVSNKTLEPKVAELFIHGKKLNIFLVSITKSYFAVLKDNRRNSISYFIMKILNKRKLFYLNFYFILFFLKKHTNFDYSRLKLQKNKIN